MLWEPPIQEIDKSKIFWPFRLRISAVPHRAEYIVGTDITDFPHLIRFRSRRHDDKKTIFFRNIAPADPVCDLIAAAARAVKYKHGRNRLIFWRRIRKVYIPFSAIRVSSICIITTPDILGIFFEATVIYISCFSECSIVIARITVNPVK